MGGCCCSEDILVESPAIEDKRADITSDWDEVEHELDLDPPEESLETSNGEVESLEQLEEKEGVEEEVAETNDVMDDESSKDTVEQSTQDEPFKEMYGEKEFLTKKRKAFTLDMELYSNVTKS